MPSGGGSESNNMLHHVPICVSLLAVGVEIRVSLVFHLGVAFLILAREV